MASIAHDTPTAPAKAERRISKAEEKAIARSLSPGIAWPTVILTFLFPAAYVALAWLGLSGKVSSWLLTPVLGLVSYAHYSLVHEAVHGNLVVEPKSLRWFNTFAGWVGAIGLGIGWPLLQRTHVLHHSHTNTDKDPDIYVKGTFWQLIGKWARDSVPGYLPLVLYRFVMPDLYRQLRAIMSDREILQCSLLNTVLIGLLGVGFATGHALDWLLLLFVPQQIGVLILMIFFQWLPHYPFDRFDRYGNTRISLWAGGKVFTLQQNLHLMHHLWPSVPFYNYFRLFVALRPVLEYEGARIEGFRPRG